MDSSGEAAEQVVRMSLEGVEVAARITGEGAKNIAVLLYSILKEEKKTKGKARLTSMLRSGKELKVFTVRQKDLAKFTKEAKKYGVLYCVLTDCDCPRRGRIQNQPYCGTLQSGVGGYRVDCRGGGGKQGYPRRAGGKRKIRHRKTDRRSVWQSAREAG